MVDINIQKEMIKLIKTNRISTTEVADCLGKTGLYKNAKAINRGHLKVGPVNFIYGYADSNYPLHEQARYVEEGAVVLTELYDCDEEMDRAAYGELVCKYLLLYRQAEAIVSNANMRDGNDIIKNNFPVWCKGLTPIGTFNKKPNYEMDKDFIAAKKKQYDGAVAVCDDSGVVIIPPECITYEFIDKLHKIEEQEDIWFNCLDRKKWDTFDIVCKKRYLNEE